MSDAAEAILRNAGVELSRSRETLTERSKLQLGLRHSHIEAVFREIGLVTAGRFEAAVGDVNTVRHRIERDCQHNMILATRDLQGSLDSLLSTAGSIQREARTCLDLFVEKIVGPGPEATLRRGYAIARDTENRTIASKGEAIKHQTLQVQFRDGQLAVENHEDPTEDRR